jgi:ferredoxin
MSDSPVAPRRVTVDRGLCEGQVQCQLAAPEVFEVRDDDDQTHVLIDPVPDDLAGKVAKAIASCPRGALRWSDRPQN